MKKSTKTLLGVLGGFAAVFLIVVALGIYWFSTSGKQYVQQFFASTEKQIAEGKGYGKTTDDNGCLTEAIERINRADSTSSLLAAHLFFNGCLDSCKITPEFCRDVPAEGEIIDSVKWAMRKCNELGAGLNDKNCQQIVKAIRRHCNKVQKKATGNEPETGPAK